MTDVAAALKRVRERKRGLQKIEPADIEKELCKTFHVTSQHDLGVKIPSDASLGWCVLLLAFSFGFQRLLNSAVLLFALCVPVRLHSNRNLVPSKYQKWKKHRCFAALQTNPEHARALAQLLSCKGVVDPSFDGVVWELASRVQIYTPHHRPITCLKRAREAEVKAIEDAYAIQVEGVQAQVQKCFSFYI